MGISSQGRAAGAYVISSSCARRFAAAITFLAILAIPIESFAQACVRYVATSGADGSNDCQSLGTPCDTIQHAIAEADPDDVICIASGVYSEQPVVSKPVTLLGTGTPITAADAAGYTSITYVGPGPDQDIVRVEAPGVVIRNINIRADLSTVTRALYANAAADDLLIDRMRVASFQSVGTLASRRTAIALNFAAPSGGPLSGVVVRDSFIVREPASAAFFQDGIRAAEAGALDVFGNLIEVSTQGVQAKFSLGNVRVANNTITGGGVEIGEHNAGVSSVIVEDNSFSPLPQFAGTALRLQQNNPTGAVFPTSIVRRNNFGTSGIGHTVGVWLQNYPQVSIEGNTFFPLDVALPGVLPAHGVIVSSKVVASTSASPALPTFPFDGISITGNRFRGCGANTCTAIRFADHRNEPGNTAFGSMIVGGAGPAANAFAASLTRVIVLDDQSGASNTATVPQFAASYSPASIGVTNMARFAGDVAAPRNTVGVTTFDGSGNPTDGTDTTSMSVAQLVALNQSQVEDRRDDALPKARGTVQFGAPNVAYAFAGPGSLPVGSAPFAAGDCTGTENATGCYSLDLANAGVTAVAEHLEVGIAITRAGGPGGGGGLVPGSVALEYETTPGNFQPVALSADGSSLLGALPVIVTPATQPPYALEANTPDVLARARIRFTDGGDYTLTTSARGKETTNLYGSTDVHLVGVVDTGTLVVGDDLASGAGAARTGLAETYALSLDNAIGGTSEPLALNVTVRGQDDLPAGALTLGSTFGPITLAPQPDGSLLGSVVIGPTLQGAALLGDLVATYADPDTYRYTFTVTNAAGTPVRTYGSATKTVVAGDTTGAGATYFVRSTSDTASASDDIDNDYTRIADVVRILQSNDTVLLDGRFDWSAGPAYVSWSLGMNGVDDAANSREDWAIRVPAGLLGVTFTATGSLGAGPPGPTQFGATIVGGGDSSDPARIDESQEGFLVFHDAGDVLPAETWTGLQVSNLHLEGFDVALNLRTTAAEGTVGEDDFDNLVVRDNTIRVPADVFAPGNESAASNEGLIQGWGSNQLTERNRVFLDSSGDGNSGQLGLRFGGNCNIACYDGLVVRDNVVELAVAGPGFVRGMYENAGDTGSDILIEGNVIDLELPGAGTDRGGLVLQSISNTATGTTVRVRGNTIAGATEFGIRVEGTVSPFPNEAGVVIEGNTILGGDNALRVSDRFTVNPPAPVLRQNRLVGQATNAIQIQDDFGAPFAATIDATHNWFGCNGGPGQPAAPALGCTTATAAVPALADADPWLVLTLDATPGAIDLANTSTLAASFTEDSDGGSLALPIEFPDGTPVAFTSTPVADATPVDADGTSDGVANANFDPAVSGLHLLSAMTDGQTVYTSIVVTSANSVTIVPASPQTSFDNDYTRVNNALQLIGSNGTVVLDGTFDWTHPFANDSWRRGSDGVAEAACATPGVDCGDDWSIVPPGGRPNVTVRGDGVNGTRGGRIVGPGDLPSDAPGGRPYAFESVFYLYPGCFTGWTIENLELEGFDTAIQMYNGGHDGTCPDQAYEGVAIRANRFVMPPDVIAEGQVPATDNSFQNYAIHFSFGRNQAIADNEIVIPGTGSGDATRRPATFAMQSNTSGGTIYDGLAITNNQVLVTGAPAAADSEFVGGIWENAHAHLSDIEVADNRVVFVPSVGGGAPRPRSIGFEVTSHSSASTSVVYRGNTVIGFENGIGWLDTPYELTGLSALSPVQLVGNDIVRNGVGVRVRAGDDSARATLVLNRFFDNGTALASEDNEATPAANLIVADDNWWGCNAGPAGDPAQCDSIAATAGFDAVAVADWLRLSLSASPSAIAPGASSALTATLDDQGGSPLDFTLYPKAERVIFATSLGGVLPLDDDFANDGTAASVLSTAATDQGGAQVYGDYDNATATSLVRVGGATFTITSCTSEPGCTQTPLDNDYTRINNVVQVLQAGDTLELAGTFDWSLGPAYDSWSRGSDGAFDPPGSVEDFSIDVPAGLTDLTIRGLAGATILGGGDLATRPDALFENFLMFWDRNDPSLPGSTSWANLEISGLTIDGFDVGLFLVTTASEGVDGVDDFDDLYIHDNVLRVAADFDGENDGGAGVGNYGIYQGWGSNQRTQDNAFVFDTSGGGDSGSVGLLVGGNCNVACYDGLVVRGNTFTIGTDGDGYVRALFENGADTGSDITIEGNTIDFAGADAGSDLGGIHVESFSNDGPTPATVAVRDNTVSGANTFGIRVSAVALSPVAGESGVIVEGNTILGGDNAVFVADRYGRAPPAPEIHFNRLVGQATTALSHNFATLAIDASNNWFGCNGGPGFGPAAGCATATGGIAGTGIDADPWLALALEPAQTVVPRNGQTAIVANLDTNSAAQDVSGTSRFPASPVTFATPSGVSTLDATLVNTGAPPYGVAPNALRQMQSTTTATAMLDGQTVSATVVVEAVSLDLNLPPAALTGVTTTPFTVRVRNDGDPITESVSAYFAVDHLANLVGADVTIEYLDGATWETAAIGDSNSDGVLEGIVPLGALGVGEISVSVRLTFNDATQVGDYTFDGLVVGDVTGAFYAEDTGIVRVAAESDVVVTAVSGTPQTAPVGQPYTSPLAARVTAFGLPLSGVTVDFDTPTSGQSATFGALSTNSATTDATGLATSAAFTANLIAGPFNATVSVDECSGAACSANYSLRNTADAPASVSLAATCTTATVATEFCGAGNDLAATVRDANANPVEGVSVTFAIGTAASGASASAAPGITALTNASGVASVALTANDFAGAYAVVAQVAGAGGPITSSSAPLANTADANPAQIALQRGTGNGQTAQIGTPYGLPLQAFIVDRFGNRLGAGYSVTFSSPAAGAGVTFAQPQPIASNANGEVNAGVVANSTTGTFQVNASITTPACAAPGCSTSYTLTNVTTGAASVDLVAVPTQAPVDSGNYSLTATVRDAGNNLVQGASVSFVVDYGANGAGTDSNAVVSNTNASGVAVATFDANTIAGAFSIDAIVSGTSGDSVALENLSGAATQLVTVSGSNQSAEVGTLFAQSLVVRAEDGFDNPVAGVTVTFAGPAGGASATFEAPQVLTTGANGLASTTARANATAGSYGVTATSGPLSTGFSLTNTVDTDDISLVLAGTPVGSVAAIGTVYSQFTASTTNTGSGIAENVVVNFLVGRAGGASVGDIDVQYQSTTADCGSIGTYCSIPLVDSNNDGILEGRFGPASGFPLGNVTTNLRASFTAGGAYVVDAEVTGVTSDTAYASADLSVDVAQLDLVETAAVSGVVGEFVNSSSSLRNDGTAGLNNGALLPPAAPAPNDASVQGRLTISHATPLTTADVEVEYFDVSSGNWLPLPLAVQAGSLVGTFGPAAGFPVPAGYDATTLFRSRFLKTGNHTFITLIRGVDGAGTATGIIYDASVLSVGIDTGAAESIEVVSGTPQSATVAQGFANPLVVRVRDAGGNPVSGAQVSFTSTPSGAGATFTGTNPATTDGSGFAQVSATANSIAGEHDVTASISNGDDVAFDLTNLADATNDQLSVVAESGAGQTAPINATYGADLVVRVVDRFGNPVAGRSIAFSAPSPGASASFVPAGAVTDVDGRASTRPTANGLPGAFQVIASDADCVVGAGNACSASLGLTNTVAAPTSLSLAILPDGDADASDAEAVVGALPAGGGAYVLQATVTDGTNAVPGVSVTFVVDEGANGAGVTPTSITATTDVDGLANAAFNANSAAGAFTVRAVASGVTPTADDAVALTNLPAAASIVTGTPGSATTQETPVGNAFAQPLVVTVTDAFGNVRAGEAITFVVGSAGAASATIAPSGPYLTNANGQVSVVATANSTAGGPYTVTASHSTAGSAAFSLRNLPAGAAAMTAVAGSTPQSTVVDTDFDEPLAVRIVDGSGNPVAGVVVNFIAPASAASADLSAVSDTTDVDGIASVDATANTVAGTYDVVASSSAGTVSFSLTNTPNATRTMTAQPGSTPQSTPISTAFGGPLAVRIVDSFGNPVAGTLVTYAAVAAANGASATLDTLTDTTDANGIASVVATANATAGGPHLVTATSADGTVNFSLTNLVGGSISIVKVAGDAQTDVAAGTNVPLPPSVRVVDAGNNPVSGVAVTFAVASGGGSVTGAIANTDVDGLATVGSWTLGPAANAANTLTAAASGAATVTFTATSGDASNDVTVDVDNLRTTVRETQSYVYTVKITNNGTGTASGITLAATYTGLDDTFSTWICVASGGSCPAGSGSGSIAGQAFTLAPGASLTFAVSAQVIGTPDSNASLVVTANLPASADPALANNTDDDVDLITDFGDALFEDGFED